MTPQPEEPVRGLEYYDRFDESTRLSSHRGRLEFVRTQEILKRWLPSPPATILDVGGAAGRYSLWLAGRGYTVHLVDPVPHLVARAAQASLQQPDAPIASSQVGDARSLDFCDATFDAVLMLGPLYHLQEQTDRLKALQETRRTLKDAGMLFAAAISRFASVIDGLVHGYLKDPAFARIVHKDLKDGRHRNPTADTAYFTDAFFHRPERLSAELKEAGFEPVRTLAIEGLAGMMSDLGDVWEDAARRQQLLDVLRLLEAESSLIGASSHIMCVARKID